MQSHINGAHLGPATCVLHRRTPRRVNAMRRELELCRRALRLACGCALRMRVSDLSLTVAHSQSAANNK